MHRRVASASAEGALGVAWAGVGGCHSNGAREAGPWAGAAGGSTIRALAAGDHSLGSAARPLPRSQECREFKNGRCSRGDACRFNHVGAPAGEFNDRRFDDDRDDVSAQPPRPLLCIQL